MAATYTEDAQIQWIAKDDSTSEIKVDVKKGRAEIESLYHDVFKDAKEKTTLEEHGRLRPIDRAGPDGHPWGLSAERGQQGEVSLRPVAREAGGQVGHEESAILRDFPGMMENQDFMRTARIFDLRLARTVRSVALALLPVGAFGRSRPLVGGRIRPARRCASASRPDPVARGVGRWWRLAPRRSRVPWTGSKIAGTPEPPPPYTVALAFPNLKFEFPVVLVRAKGTARLFLGDLRGRIYSFPNDPGCKKADLAIELAKLHPDLTALYGLTVHPDFDKNRYVYVCYVRKNDVPDGSVVSRFVVSRTDPPVIDPGSEQVILTFWSGGHNGGCLDFGTDGYLYISTGDGAGPSPPDTHDDRPRLLRLAFERPPYRRRPLADRQGLCDPGRQPVRERARRPARDLGVRVSQPVEDEHRPGDRRPVGRRRRLGAVGDDPQGPSWGQPRLERDGRSAAGSRRRPAGATAILPPLKAHPHSEAASITGGYVYHGTRLPELAGAYIYGDYQTGIIWALRSQGETVTWEKELARTPLHLVAFGETEDGELYLVDHDRTHQIYRLVPDPAANVRHDFPRRLSQTGLFASTRDHRPAPGVVPYQVNAELWADGATAERLLAVPGAAASVSMTRATGGSPRVRC